MLDDHPDILCQDEGKFRRFGRGRWSLTVDMDELFDYPYSDVVGLGSLLRYLNSGEYTAVVAQMLDMFPEKLLSSVVGDERELADREDEPLKELHRFYDISGVRVQEYYPALGYIRAKVLGK
jgi:hypothetical protein